MPEGLERIELAVSLIIIFIGGVLYWLFHVGLLITSPVFSLLIIMAGVILIIVAIVKKLDI